MALCSASSQKRQDAVDQFPMSASAQLAGKAAMFADGIRVTEIEIRHNKTHRCMGFLPFVTVLEFAGSQPEAPPSG